MSNNTTEFNFPWSCSGNYELRTHTSQQAVHELRTHTSQQAVHELWTHITTGCT